VEQRVAYDRGNKSHEPVSLRKLVSDRQFKSGYRDVLAGRPPPRFYYDPTVGEDTWGYERGRLVGRWLLATGQKPPRANDISGLMRAYQAAEDADGVI
jgi:hypothetical protein